MSQRQSQLQCYGRRNNSA